MALIGGGRNHAQILTHRAAARLPGVHMILRDIGIVIQTATWRQTVTPATGAEPFRADRGCVARYDRWHDSGLIPTVSADRCGRFRNAAAERHAAGI